MALADGGDENVVEAVVVVVADRHTEAEKRNAQAGLASHVGEGAVVVVVVELQRGGAAFGVAGVPIAPGSGEMGWMTGPIPTVDEQDVGPAVVVIVNEGTTRTHGFGQPFLAEGAVIVGEVDSCLGGDVAEGDGLRAGCHSERKGN